MCLKTFLPFLKTQTPRLFTLFPTMHAKPPLTQTATPPQGGGVTHPYKFQPASLGSTVNSTTGSRQPFRGNHHMTGHLTDLLVLVS